MGLHGLLQGELYLFYLPDDELMRSKYVLEVAFIKE
jgi:hypothetical protein